MLRSLFGHLHRSSHPVLRLVVVVGASALVAACGGTDGGNEMGTTSAGSGGGATSGTGGGGATSFTPSGFSCSGATVHYSTDVAPIFAAHCGGVEGCHIPMHTAAGAYNLVVSQPATECTDPRLQVMPGDPEHSYLINKVTDTNLCGDFPPMPKALSTWIELPPNIIQPVYDWICEGAKND